jgi:hypothetical protein
MRTRIASSKEFRDAIYKNRLLPPDCPRNGDDAVVVRGHTHTTTGLPVKVVNDPHYCEVTCAECGSVIKDWVVEVEHSDPRWPKEKGPYFFPVGWLRRVLPLSSSSRRN